MNQARTLEDQVLMALRRIVRAIDLHSRRLFDQYGLTGPQLVTLRAAWALEGSASAGAVARVVQLSQPTVSGILDRLERQGLVARVRDDSDRRNVLIRVTPAGESVVRGSASLLQDRFVRAFRDLPSWEQLQMLSTLQRIAFMMDAEEIDAAPLLVSDSFDSVATTSPNPAPGGLSPTTDDISPTDLAHPDETSTLPKGRN
jgi:DNA-binding MarR family transcriptional regulator